MKTLINFTKHVLCLVVMLHFALGNTQGVNRGGVDTSSASKTVKSRSLKKSIKKHTKIRRKNGRTYYNVSKTTKYWR